MGDGALLSQFDEVGKSIFAASVEKPIGEYDLRALSFEMERALKWITKDVGYRVAGAEDWQYITMRTTSIVRKYFSNLSLKDVQLAFELSVTGELDDYLPRTRDGQADRNHYQQFSAEYICKILNAYVVRRGWVLKKIYDSRPKPKQLAQGDEYGDILKRDFYNTFLEFKYRGRLPDISAIAEMLYYQILEKVGLADEIEVTEREQEIILFRTVRSYMSKGLNYDAERLRKEGNDSPEIQTGAFALARKKALVEVFKRLVKDEIQLSDYLC